MSMMLKEMHNVIDRGTRIPEKEIYYFVHPFLHHSHKLPLLALILHL